MDSRNAIRQGGKPGDLKFRLGVKDVARQLPGIGDGGKIVRMIDRHALEEFGLTEGFRSVADGAERPETRRVEPDIMGLGGIAAQRAPRDIDHGRQQDSGGEPPDRQLTAAGPLRPPVETADRDRPEEDEGLTAPILALEHDTADKGAAKPDRRTVAGGAKGVPAARRCKGSKPRAKLCALHDDKYGDQQK